ncbi:alpha-ketoglutarate-dependent dioxygenase alkB homolog 7, mitochondrial-like [Pecten maximus]|uniref:alpha-ketoglutarate-dependent dioxygenase alkB homolog 7, mitochondrial-like n=1 Tax=Pecten maximus TaxID=6579 RepID=UPI0014585640|nr:alpha-ketoglutarate-dependent dioxygenase alkB homolog 7, mitochondrial-like [Pecten maximus]
MSCRTSGFVRSLRTLTVTRLKCRHPSTSQIKTVSKKCLSSRNTLRSSQHVCTCLSSCTLSNSLLNDSFRHYTTSCDNASNEHTLGDAVSFMTTTDPQTALELEPSMHVYKNFISPDEEEQLFNEIEPYMKRLRYEYDHWDGAIQGYRETERKKWTKNNEAILKRVGDLAFPPAVQPLAHVHILDLSKDGHIKPHIDAVRFCGSTIAGLCLLSPCVMRLVHDKDKQRWADILLDRRSLYIMKDAARFNYTHEVLSNENSVFNGHPVPKDRRISVIMRNEPDE